MFSKEIKNLAQVSVQRKYSLRVMRAQVISLLNTRTTAVIWIKFVPIHGIFACF